MRGGVRGKKATNREEIVNGVVIEDYCIFLLVFASWWGQLSRGTQRREEEMGERGQGEEGRF